MPVTAGLRQPQLAVSAALLGRISRGLRWIRSGLSASPGVFRPHTRLRSLPNKATSELTGWLIGQPVFTLRAGGSWSLQPGSAPAALRLGRARPGRPSQLSPGTRFAFATARTN